MSHATRSCAAPPSAASRFGQSSAARAAARRGGGRRRRGCPERAGAAAARREGEAPRRRRGRARRRRRAAAGRARARIRRRAACGSGECGCESTRSASFSAASPASGGQQRRLEERARAGAPRRRLLQHLSDQLGLRRIPLGKLRRQPRRILAQFGERLLAAGAWAQTDVPGRGRMLRVPAGGEARAHLEQDDRRASRCRTGRRTAPRTTTGPCTAGCPRPRSSSSGSRAARRSSPAAAAAASGRRRRRRRRGRRRASASLAARPSGPAREVARPKSPNLMFSLKSMKMLPGFRSRWMIPCAWMWLRPCRIWRRRFHDCSSSSGAPSLVAALVEQILERALAVLHLDEERRRRRRPPPVRAPPRRPAAQPCVAVARIVAHVVVVVRPTPPPPPLAVARRRRRRRRSRGPTRTGTTARTPARARSNRHRRPPRPSSSWHSRCPRPAPPSRSKMSYDGSRATGRASAGERRNRCSRAAARPPRRSPSTPDSTARRWRGTSATGCSPRGGSSGRLRRGGCAPFSRVLHLVELVAHVPHAPKPRPCRAGRSPRNRCSARRRAAARRVADRVERREAIAEWPPTSAMN